MKPLKPKPLLTHKDVHEFLNMSPNGLHNLCKSGKGPPRIRISVKLFRYDPDEFQAWLAKRGGTR